MPAMPLIAVGLIAVGTGYSAYSQYQAGKSSQALNNYNAQQEQVNAAAAVRDANIGANAERHRNQQLLAKQRAGFSASGAAMDTGSPLVVQMESAARLEMGALETERQGGIQASRDLQQSQLDKMSGSAAKRTGTLNAASTILQGANSAIGQYAHYKGIS